MASLTLKDLPPDLHQRLKERAARNRRSLNSEAILCLEQALAASPTDPDAYLTRIRPLRDKTKRLPLTDDRLREARDHGRP